MNTCLAFISKLPVERGRYTSPTPEIKLKIENQIMLIFRATKRENISGRISSEKSKKHFSLADNTNYAHSNLRNNIFLDKALPDM